MIHIHKQYNPLLIIVLLCITSIASSLLLHEILFAGNSYQLAKQPAEINKILKNEKETTRLKKLIEEIKYIDETYSQLYQKLKNDRKIVIFFDPAHGKLPDGRWQGEVTGRSSSTGTTEEYYSIQIARKLYSLLKKNRYIEVASTDDFIACMEGTQDYYDNIPFTRTVEMAYQAGAFIVISEHLNNTSIIHKAGGMANIPGIHVTYNNSGQRYLSHIRHCYKGFLTLYNKIDASGFSHTYAKKLKESLVKSGLTPNNWEHGTVADDRFTYFIEYPVSVIFESGFISYPPEEKKLNDPDHQELLANAQYDTLMDSIRNIFGVDISGFWLKRYESSIQTRLTMLKMGRMACYYLKNDSPEKAESIIKSILKRYKDPSFKPVISNYRQILAVIQKTEKYRKKAKYYIKKKKISHARKYLRKGISITSGSPLFTKLNDLCVKEYSAIKPPTRKHRRATRPSGPIKTSWNTPVLFVVESGQSIDTAIKNAFNPDDKTFKKLKKNFKHAYRHKWVKLKKYSKKKKKYIYYWKKRSYKINFTEGIYIVRLGKNQTVKKVKKVSRVKLDPWRYQNHQYLKNSCCATYTRSKGL